MGPLTPSGSEATMYLSVAVFLHEHAFDSIQKFRETITVRKDGVFRMSIPEFNHWVLLLPPANPDSLQVKQLGRNARRYCCPCINRVSGRLT